jgi:hypothetical protein
MSKLDPGGLKEVVAMKGLIALWIGLALALPAKAQDVVPETLFVPVGTVLTVQSKEFLSSDRNLPGEPFRAMLQQPLVVDGWVVARPGQTVIGHVVSAQKAGRANGSSLLGLELTEILLVDGQQVPVRTQLLQSYGPENRRDDVAMVAAGTLIGTVIGAAAGGGKGAAIGAGAGAAASVAGVLSTRGKPTEVYPETPLVFRLDAPLNISTVRSAHAFTPVSAEDYRETPVLQGPRNAPAPRRVPYRTRAVYPVPVFSYPHPTHRRVGAVVVIQPSIVFPLFKAGGRYRRY